MDPDLPNIDVQQNLHLPFPFTDSGRKDLHTANPRDHSRPHRQQCRPHIIVDLSM